MDCANQSLATLLGDSNVTRVEAFVADVNGVPRGKRLIPAKAGALAKQGLALPQSVFALDIWGADVADAGLAFGTGDPDGFGYPVPGRAAVVPALDPACVQVMLTMRDEAGKPLVADPRGVLARVVARLAGRGLRPVVATELEFYLHRLDGGGRPLPPDASDIDNLLHANETLSMATMGRHSALFDDIYAACAALNVPADTLLSEAGPGQFELNLLHRDDALAAADDAILLKRIVKGVAGRHGLAATFMAKPYGSSSGSGMHVHASLLDADDNNILANADGSPSERLLHAVGGLLRSMPDMMLAFAPHLNSYRRYRPNAHVAVTAGWGRDDRTAAVRVVIADAMSTRIEHRVSGADCNPYLVVAAVLAGMLAGIEDGVAPPPEQDRARPELGTPLPVEWNAAIDAFAASSWAAGAFGERFRDVYAACKRQDRDRLLAWISDAEYASYLSSL